MMESQDEAAPNGLVIEGGDESKYAYNLHFKIQHGNGNVFLDNEVSSSLRPITSIYWTIYQLSRGCYASENEIVRYSRAGVLVVAGRAHCYTRDSTRTKGDEKSCEGSLGAIWSSNVSNYVCAWK